MFKKSAVGIGCNQLLKIGTFSQRYQTSQGESVNILLNFTQFFETRIEYRFQIFTAHSCDFLLPSYARLA